jgi:ATP-dependent RNA helicase DDX35
MSLNFWKPGATGPGSNLDRDSQTEENVLTSAPFYSSSSYSLQSIQAQREHLPIFKHRERRFASLYHNTHLFFQVTNYYIPLKNMVST